MKSTKLNSRNRFQIRKSTVTKFNYNLNNAEGRMHGKQPASTVITTSSIAAVVMA